MQMLPVQAIQAALAAGVEIAARAETPIVIALVDAGGRLSGLMRMPGAFLASNEYAEWKAWTAASFAMPTVEFSRFLSTVSEDVRAGLLAHDKVTALSGGVPIRVEGTVIAAVGVSGGPGELDEACAEAACEAFRTALG